MASTQYYVVRISFCRSIGEPSLGKVSEFSNVRQKFQFCDSIALPCYLCSFKVPSLSNLLVLMHI